MSDDMPALEVNYRKWNYEGAATKIELSDADQVFKIIVEIK